MENGCGPLKKELELAMNDLIFSILEAKAAGKEPGTHPKVIEKQKKVDIALNNVCACKCVYFAREGFLKG